MKTVFLVAAGGGGFKPSAGKRPLLGEDEWEMEKGRCEQ